MNIIKLLIVDDHFIVREGLQLILETVEDIEIIGEAGNGQEVLKIVCATPPDVILMDMQMPVMDGLTAIQHLRRDAPQIAIIILTTFNEDRLMLQGLQAGAKGFLLKDVTRETLLNTIYAAARGETLLPPDVMARLLSFTPSKAGGAESRAASPEIHLTDRELEVLRGVAEGQTNKGISLDLHITERTVKAHLASIYEKLGVNSRAAAISAAVQHGIL